MIGGVYLSKLQEKTPAEVKTWLTTASRRVSDAAAILVTGKSPEARAEFAKVEQLMESGLRAEEIPARLREYTTAEEIATLDEKIHGTVTTES